MVHSANRILIGYQIHIHGVTIWSIFTNGNNLIEQNIFIPIMIYLIIKIRFGNEFLTFNDGEFVMLKY